MQNTSFIFEEETVFCEDCFQSKFAEHCHGCKRPISGVCVYACTMYILTRLFVAG